MEYEFDYYVINSTGEPNVPLLMNDDNEDADGLRFLSLGKERLDVKSVYLTLNPPVPSKPNLNVDYLQLPSPVFSEKIKEALEKLNISGFQLVPAIINGKKGEEYKDFYIANIYNIVECFDSENSIYKLGPLTKRWTNIKKIVLDRNKLSQIPLENRLAFHSKETRMFTFYHKSVVDAIMATHPTNVRFTSVENWYEGIQFNS